MAENKKSFLLYCDLIHTVQKMPPEKAGELFLHILKYVNDQNPTSEDLIINLTFEPIKQQLKRDLVKYEGIRKKNSDNARKRWDATASSGMPTDAKHADSDTDSDSVTDTVNDKDTDKGKERVLKTHSEIIEAYFFDFYNGSDIERVSMDLKTPLDRIRELMGDFRAHCEVSYPTYAKFVFHFKNWARIKLTEKTKENPLIGTMNAYNKVIEKINNGSI